jgi:hypothetical protein
MRRLARLRRVLAMDANEAIDRPIGAYIDLFRKHPIPTHLLGTAMTAGVFAALWLIAGGRAALLTLGIVWVLPILLATAHFLRRSRQRGPR